MKPEGKNDAMLRRMFRNAFESAYQAAHNSFLDLKNQSDIKGDFMNSEINALMYFVFDFGISMGPETRIRDTLRELLAASLELSVADNDLYCARAKEYLGELQNNLPEKNKMLNFGNVFAKHTGNPEDMLVVAWVVEQMTSNMELVKKIMDRILSGLPR
jgi:hypothetical protein